MVSPESSEGCVCVCWLYAVGCRAERARTKRPMQRPEGERNGGDTPVSSLLSSPPPVFASASWFLLFPPCSPPHTTTYAHTHPSLLSGEALRPLSPLLCARDASIESFLCCFPSTALYRAPFISFLYLCVCVCVSSFRVQKQACVSVWGRGVGAAK
ncbi:histone H3 [Leishmania donovani]|uniref:Histone H3 n=1 Tax=Leishmania donovani TaxID=5661 RepID=E9BAE9_LEIDO|nr:histone H3 [Leishmania donovani]CBZ32222.1 histone H3 [Leishmania donovani]